LTSALVIGGVAFYPEVSEKAATVNNNFVFEHFLGHLFVVLFFAWIGEKAAKAFEVKRVNAQGFSWSSRFNTLPVALRGSSFLNSTSCIAL
jgi:hypothetical protein